MLPYTTVVFGCESAGAKTGVAGRLTYHVHANDTAAALPGWSADPVRVTVSWATPFFGKTTCSSEIIAAPSLGRTDSANHDCNGNHVGRGRPLTVIRTATTDEHNKVTFVLQRQQGLRGTGMFGHGSITSPANVADLSLDEISAAYQAIDRSVTP